MRHVQLYAKQLSCALSELTRKDKRKDKIIFGIRICLNSEDTRIFVLRYVSEYGPWIIGTTNTKLSRVQICFSEAAGRGEIDLHEG